MPDETPDAQAFERLDKLFRGSSKGDAEAQEMGKNRRLNARLNGKTGSVATPAGLEGASLGGASLGGGFGGGGTSMLTPRPRDPMWYWRQNNLPFDIYNADHLWRIRQYARLLYRTNPLIASCIDIYSKYPILGMELQCKDSQLEEFYNDLFFDEEDGLDYNTFLLDFGRQFWTDGEVFALGNFDEQLGIWKSDELLNPDDIEVQRSPFMKEFRFFMAMPEPIRTVLETKSPAWEYNKLIQTYPDMAQYSRPGTKMPVNNVLLKQYRFKADAFHTRGVPILLRALRTMFSAEVLNASQDAIADRLYTPFILWKLGLPAGDMGNQRPWIPRPEALDDFAEQLNEAMAADVRFMVHHFGVQTESVLGREQMPDLTADFERLEDQALQTFGLSKTMLTGASSGQTYAADALNRDLISQLLTTYQRELVKHFRSRAKVVAEAQEHFDYEERNGRRYVKMEEVWEVDEETGEGQLVQKPKLLIPDLKFRSLNLRDEEAERQFMESLRMAGVPISMKTRLRNTSIDLNEEIERSKDEQVQLAIAEQETRRRIFAELRNLGYPLPEGLLQDFSPMAQQEGAPAALSAAPQARVPVMGVDPVTGTPTIAPGQQDLALPPDQTAGEQTDAEDQAAALGGQVPAGGPAGAAAPDVQPQEGEQRPEESDEQRAGMPRPASLMLKNTERLRALAKEHYRAPEPVVITENGKEVSRTDAPGRGFQAPKHIGLSKHLSFEQPPAPDTEDEDEGA